MRGVLALLGLLIALPAAAAETALDQLYKQVAASYDGGRGGFVTRDQAPLESAIELAFALGRERGDPEWTARAHATVDWMHALYDSVGGGFVLRLKDNDPMEPHFEKPTWANARRLENLIDAWQRGGDEAERRYAADVLDYMERVLYDGRGGFIAGQVGDRALLAEPNGYAIHSWLRWAAAAADKRVRDMALKSLDRVWEKCWAEDLGFIRVDEFGQPQGAPWLVDQVLMGRAVVLAVHLGGREVDLNRARVLGDLVLDRFENPKDGGFVQRATMRTDGKEVRGTSKLEDNSHAVRFLAELASVTGDSRYRDAARRAERRFEKSLGRAGFAAADWALALRAVRAPDLPPRPKWKEVEKKPDPPRVFRPGRGG
jgi:uncharacterized protein YyaL (SSP411 family)